MLPGLMLVRRLWESRTRVRRNQERNRHSKDTGRTRHFRLSLAGKPIGRPSVHEVECIHLHGLISEYIAGFAVRNPDDSTRHLHRATNRTLRGRAIPLAGLGISFFQVQRSDNRGFLVVPLFTRDSFPGNLCRASSGLQSDRAFSKKQRKVPAASDNRVIRRTEILSNQI